VAGRGGEELRHALVGEAYMPIAPVEPGSDAAQSSVSCPSSISCSKMRKLPSEVRGRAHPG